MKKLLSINSLRTLAVVGLLFVCSLNSFAVYYETIEAGGSGFYLYNEAAKKYLARSGGGLIMTSEITNATPWVFSGKTGTISMKNDSYAVAIRPPRGTSVMGIYETDPGEGAKGSVVLVAKDTTFTLGGDVNGYTFANQGKYGLGGRTKRYYYFSTAITAIYPSGTTTTWKLRSKRQFDNTITLSDSTLALEAIQGGDPATAQFYVNYDGNPTSISLTDGTNTLTISSPVENQHTILVSYQVDASGAQTITLTDGSNAANKATFSFVAGSSATLGLTLSTTAASGNAIDKDKKPMTITGAVVTLKPQDIDWTQDFSALSLTTAPIALNAVAKTTGGVATGKTITYSLSSTGVVKIVSNKLYVLSEGTTTITAKVAKDATYVGASKSLTINVSGVPTSATTITPGNASSTGIYTGTVGGPTATYAFHREKRQVDLTKCFDNGGQALFDTLYIFGMTMNTDGVLVSYTGTNGVAYTNVPKINTPSASVVCNATTPCYVYAKSGNTYVHTRTFDATQTRYDWGTKQNGKHIYFTGYCPFAYMGVTPTEDGWMYFKGGNTNVDIYLDSCQILGRYKTQSGKNAGYENYVLNLTVTQTGADKPNVNFMSGVSAPFVITSSTNTSSEKYKVHFHIAGRNQLQGQVGSYIASTMAKADLGIAQAEVDPGISKITTYSAPIVIKPTSLDQYTDLELTDIWKDGTITNGYLKLDANKGTYPTEKVPVVDLGSPNGSLTINGGQYHLRNAAADGTYSCNLAVGYRMYSKTKTVDYGLTVDVRIDLYGFGGDMTDSKVIINSGTFTMHKNMYPSGTGYLGEGYYVDQENFLDLRLPAGKGASRINGGTFNGISNVLMCTNVKSTGASPKNAQGYWLCPQDVEVTGTNPDGSAQFTIPYPFSEAYNEETPSYSLVSDKDAVVGASLYGAQSANAFVRNDSSFVRLLLPGDACEEGGCSDCEKQDESIVFNWATALPLCNALGETSSGSATVKVGGPIEVEVAPAGENIEYQTNQLMFVDVEGLQEYTFELVDEDASLSIADKSSPRGQINNEADYQIQKHLNMLKVVQADTWYTFTAPFNIHQVSVIESKNEKTISKMSRDDAMHKQAVDNIELLYDVQNFIIPEDGRASSLTFPAAAGMGKKNTFISLIHYNGSNLASAHYYLYKLKKSEFEAKIEGESGLLQIEWEPVTATDGQILMEKGKTYAIQFPYCPMCNDLDSRKYYDYWSNKYILFYGKGPQLIDGTNKHNSIIDKSAGSGSATFSGNTSFSDVTIPANGGYIHNQSTDCYELRNSSYALRPGEGFLVYNPNSEKMPARISRSGKMEFDENVSTDVDGLPTIQDHTSLMLFDAMDGFELLSLHDQMVVVYNMQGYVLYQQYMTAGEQVHIAAAPGIYVVKGEKEAIKLVVD